MSSSTIIASAIIATIATGYTLHNLKKSNNNNNTYKLSYSVDSYKEYVITNPARIYQYSVPTASFDSLERVYKMDLLNNYKKKEHIDTVLKKYLKKNIIYQKRVVFNTEGYVGDFTIVTNVNPETLVFDINNNSLEEAKMNSKIN